MCVAPLPCPSLPELAAGYLVAVVAVFAAPPICCLLVLMIAWSGQEWKSPYMLSWTPREVDELLLAATRVLLETADHLRLPVKVCWDLAASACVLQ